MCQFPQHCIVFESQEYLHSRFNAPKRFCQTCQNKENNVFKDGIGVQGLRFKVVKLSSLIPWDLGHAEQLSFSCLWSKVISDVNISETVYPIYLKINMRRVASRDSLHINF